MMDHRERFSPKHSESDMKERRIIVSIDFGTTYSGIAWAETSRVSYYGVVGGLENGC
jgi:molecular chaperone DnaK (HSP70)